MRLLHRFSALVLFCYAAASHASSFDVFHLTGVDTDLTFTLPGMPTPASYSLGYSFGLRNISFANNGVETTGARVYFYTPPISAGFSLTDSTGHTIKPFMFAGPQLFSGTTAMPTFTLGSYDLLSLYCGAGSSDGHCIQDAYKLTISAAPTPEPGSLMLLGTGVLGLVGAARRRFV